VKEVSPAVDDVQAGARLVAPRAFALPAAGSLTLDFEHGARVHVGGPARVLADLSEQDLLLVGAGTLSVDLPPSAPTPQSGFALLTPAGMISLVRGGVYALRVFEDGSTQAFVVSGTATLRVAGGSKAEGVQVVAGDAVQLTPAGALTRSQHRARTLVEAERSAQALRARGKAKLEPGGLETLLRAQLAATLPLKARQDALVAEHRAALRLREGGGERVAELQRAIAENAAQLADGRARLGLALGQRAAALQTPAQGGEDELSAEARALLVR
jgi:hypothetical protein